MFYLKKKHASRHMRNTVKCFCTKRFLHHKKILHEMILHEMILHEMILHEMILHEMILHEMILHEMILHEMILHICSVTVFIYLLTLSRKLMVLMIGAFKNIEKHCLQVNSLQVKNIREIFELTSVEMCGLNVLVISAD